MLKRKNNICVFYFVVQYSTYNDLVVTLVRVYLMFARLKKTTKYRTALHTKAVGHSPCIVGVCGLAVLACAKHELGLAF